MDKKITKSFLEEIKSELEMAHARLGVAHFDTDTKHDKIGKAMLKIEEGRYLLHMLKEEIND